MGPTNRSNAASALVYIPGIAVASYFGMHCYLALQLNNYARVLNNQKKDCQFFNEHGHICTSRVKELRATQSPGEAPYQDSGANLCKKTVQQRAILANMEPFIDLAITPSFWRRQIKEIEDYTKTK